MSTSDEIMKTLQTVWSKLQGLCEDHPFMQVAFFIIVLFFLTFIALVVIGCVYGRCGCCQVNKNRVSAV